jgi:cytochrome c5
MISVIARAEEVEAGRMNDRNIPVLVGAAQLVHSDADPEEALEPIAMLEKVAREAAVDAAAGDRALADADTGEMLPSPRCQFCHYDVQPEEIEESGDRSAR